MPTYADQPRAYNAGVTALVPGALFHFYEPSTTTPRDAYAEAIVKAPLVSGDPSTVTYAVPLPNPLTADSAARVPPIFLDGDYRILIEDPDGNTLHDLDPFTAWPGPTNPAPLSDEGEPLPFATLTFYRSKTTMLETLGGGNPVMADSAGEFAQIDLDEDIAYRALLHDQDGQLIYDVDPIFAAEDPPPAFDFFVAAGQLIGVIFGFEGPGGVLGSEFGILIGDLFGITIVDIYYEAFSSKLAFVLPSGSSTTAFTSLSVTGNSGPVVFNRTDAVLDMPGGKLRWTWSGVPDLMTQSNFYLWNATP